MGRRGHPLPHKQRGHRALPRRAARGCGAFHFHSVSLLPPVGGAQGVYPLARHPHHRRPAHLCGNGLRRRVGRTRNVPTRRAQRAHRGLRRPARLLQRGRAALGQPALQLRGHGEGRLRLVDPPHRRRAEALRRHPHRPFPRLRELLGHSLRRDDRQKRPLGQGPRHVARRRADRLVPRPRFHRRGPRLSLARGRTAALRFRVCVRLARPERLPAA